MASVRGSIAASLAAGEPWGLELPLVPRAAFHAVTAGTMWLRVADGPTIHLQPGDLVLLPRGTAHTIASGASSPTELFDHASAEEALNAGLELRAGAGPTTTRVLCASYQHDGPQRLSPFALLPEVLHVPGAVATSSLSATVRMLGDEMAMPAAGRRVVLDRTVDILLIHLLRAHLSNVDPAKEPPSWFRGLRDATTSAALTELHRDPSHGWTTAELSRRVGVSSATLARRFKSEVGQTPAGYLAGWRMTVAAQRLRSERCSVGAVARSVGYTSEFAFNRAFSRAYGVPPGRYRTAQTTDSDGSIRSE